GDAGRHRRAQRVPRPSSLRAPAPGARWEAAQGAVRDPAEHGSADVRAVHVRQAGGVVPPLHRAPAPRGVRVRGHADPPDPEAAGEAEALTQETGPAIRVTVAVCDDPVVSVQRIRTVSPGWCAAMAARSADEVSTVVPSTAVIVSPAVSPAPAAGVLS